MGIASVAGIVSWGLKPYVKGGILGGHRPIRPRHRRGRGEIQEQGPNDLERYIKSAIHVIIVQSSELPPDKKPHSFKGIWKRRTKRQKAAIIVTILVIVAYVFIGPRYLTLIVSNHSTTDHYINVTVKINGAQVVKSEIYNSGHRSPVGMKWFTVLVWDSIYHIDATLTDNNLTEDSTFFGPAGGYLEIAYTSTPLDFDFLYYISYPMYQ
jgi:hypothetical protein